jgi:serine/threonine protein kinase
MAMPLYPLGDLNSFVTTGRSMSKAQSVHAIVEISRGLYDIHRCGIAHLDMKPENILLHGSPSHFRCVIADFGISTVVTRESLTVDGFRAIFRHGFTARYAAPEIFTRASMATFTLRSADIYSFAIVIKFVLTRQIPWMEYRRR